METEDDIMTTVQMSIRLDEELRDKLKIHAINNKVKINDLLVKYLEEGLERESRL
jgi:predicted HicB family RNase H-like nuclease